MANQQQILDLTLLSSTYLVELGMEAIAEQKKGCMDCSDLNKIEQLIMLNEQLYEKIAENSYGKDTDMLYNCLLKAVASFDGASASIDPNSVTDGITIIVEGGGGGSNLPIWIDVPWSEMSNDVDGYRDTYYNPAWVGYNPAITRQGTVMYQVDIDYSNDGNGTIVFNDGKGFYDGEFFRAENYQPYGDVPPALVDLFINWS